MTKIPEPLTDIESVLRILDRISLFGGLTEAQMRTLTRSLGCLRYAVGEFVFRQGTTPNYIYIVRSGRIRLLLEGGNFSIEKALFDLGQCFGETAMIGIQAHTAAAQAIEPSELIVLSRQALLALQRSERDIFAMLILNIAREAARRLSATDQVLLHYARHDQDG